MKQTARIISTYSADVFGVCSALFELGGMVVMHDASGCNSTYTTHDEPRWYDMDSMVYISGLSEMEAIMGDDEKLIGDIVAAAQELKPNFIVVAGTPIPTMTGVDFDSIAALIEQETGIPAFGFSTTGMKSYVVGADMALAAYADRFVTGECAVDDEKEAIPAQRSLQKSTVSAQVPIKVNILGVTPLDFSVNGSVESMVEMLHGAGFQVISKWAMGSTPEELSRAGTAQVNLVVSASGFGAAKVLEKKFQIPYVIGTPIGKEICEELAALLKKAVDTGENQILWKSAFGENEISWEKTADESAKIAVIGEGITSISLAHAITQKTGKAVKVICAVECDPSLLREMDMIAMDEEEIENAIASMEIVIADPLYRPICAKDANFDENTKCVKDANLSEKMKCVKDAKNDKKITNYKSVHFIPLPAEAFSGRIFRKEIPNLVTGFDEFIKEAF